MAPLPSQEKKAYKIMMQNLEAIKENTHTTHYSQPSMSVGATFMDSTNRGWKIFRKKPRKFQESKP